jgi:multidrug resistance efflux pump
LWGAAAAALGLILIAGVVHHRVARSASRPPDGGGANPAVPAATAARRAVRATVRMSGTLSAMKSVALLAPRILGSRSGVNRGGDSNFGGAAGGGASGSDFNLVLLNLVKAGSHVKTGDVVAQFDPQNQLQRLDDYKDTVVQMENNIRNMNANLAAVKETHDQTVRAAKAAWDDAVLDLKTAPVHTEIDVEKYKLALEEAEATYKELLAESPLVMESQRAQIRVAELNRDQAVIELHRAEANVKKMTIQAPMDGIAVMANIVRNGELGQIREGDQVSAGQPFLYIVDPSSMVLEGSVNQVDIERLRLGLRGMMHVDAYPEVALPCSLIAIGAMAKTSTFRASYVGEVPVRVRIEGMDARLIPDLTGSAELVVGSEDDAVTVPRAAVFESEEGPFVLVREGEGWTRRPVRLGVISFTEAAVESGLRPGEVVALRHSQ